VEGLVKEMGEGVTWQEVDLSRDPAAGERYRIRATPTVVVLDREGKVRKTLVGVPDREELRKAIMEAAGG